MNKRMLSTQNAEEFAVCIAMDAMRLSLGKKPHNGFTPEEIARWFALMATPPSDTSGEAVAWRWRWGKMGEIAWHLSVDRPTFAEEGYQVEPLYPASALAAAEARGVQVGLERAAMTADRMAIEFDNEVHATLGVKRDPVTRHARKRAAETIATTLRSLSPAHKGSENV